jgi:anaerobic nitric oxide reductase flavorubredoxin
MWNSTRIMSEAIAEGIKASNPDIAVKLFNVARSDKNDVITEVFKSKAILMGSSTINRGILFSVAGILEMIRGMGFKKKKAASFGSYGWGGEGAGIIQKGLEEAGFEIMEEALKVQWKPDEEQRQACREFGEKLGKSL